MTERQAGEEKETAAKLIDGDSSGEVSSATVVNSLVRIYWCPQLKLLALLPGLATSTAAHGRGMACSGETTALWLEWVILRASAALLGPSARKR